MVATENAILGAVNPTDLPPANEVADALADISCSALSRKSIMRS
jgi:hypothetical protein